MRTITPCLIDPLAPPEADPRQTALRQLVVFCEGPLHPTVWRSAAWKGIGRAQIQDVLADVVQELAVDVLAAPERSVNLPERERHRRWMQIAERWIYHLRSRSRPAGPEHPFDLATLPAPTHRAEPAGTLPAPNPVKLANGRINLSATARSSGLSLPATRDRLEELAWRAGRDEDHAEFWRRRAAEALTGIAADLLRMHAGLSLLPTSRRAPDLRARLRRLRRIRQRLTVRPATRRVRSMLRHCLHAAKVQRLEPRRLLEDATHLMPDSTAAWLWLFEACVADGDLTAAARAVRRARQRARPTVRAQALARARLLEARGHLDRARDLLQRASRRRPLDGVLKRLATELAATDGRR